MADPILAQHVGMKKKIVVYGGLHYIRGNSQPYFSLTADIWERAENGGWVYSSGGAQHDEILKKYPKFSELAMIHLSGINGEPMHSVENAWYWAGNTQYQKKDIQVLAKHLRIPESTAEQLASVKDKKEFTRLVNTLKPMWKKQAIYVIKKHNLVVYGDPWKG